jgi:hypothetical protein
MRVKFPAVLEFPVVLVLLVAGSVLAYQWFLPMYRAHARRSQVGYIILAATDARKEIVYRVEERKSLAGVGLGLVIKPDKFVTGGEVSPDGIIVIRGTVDGYPVEVALKPSLNKKGELIGYRCGALKVVEGWFVPKDGYFPRTCPKVASLDSL